MPCARAEFDLDSLADGCMFAAELAEFWRRREWEECGCVNCFASSRCAHCWVAVYAVTKVVDDRIDVVH